LQKLMLILIIVLTKIAYQRLETQVPSKIHPSAPTNEKMIRYERLLLPNMG
jgi:hypothetical protein